MSLPAQQPNALPEETVRVARAIYPDGNPVMRLRDALHLEVIDSDFSDLFPLRGQPAESPARLAWVSLLQFMEGLTDRQAADAVKSAADTARSIGDEVSDFAGDVSRMAGKQFGHAQDMAADAYDEAHAAVRRNPLVALAIALGVGFLFGVVSSRR